MLSQTAAVAVAVAVAVAAVAAAYVAAAVAVVVATTHPNHMTTQKQLDWWQRQDGYGRRKKKKYG